MSPFSQDQERESLQKELETKTYQEMLKQLKQSEPYLSEFASWGDVIAFMQEGSPRNPRKEGVLRSILQVHDQDRDPRWRTILLLMFWPALGKIQSQKAGWDEDPQERWHNVIWAFIMTVSNLDSEKIPERLVQEVINKTAYAAHEEYRRIRKHDDREVRAEQEELEALAGGVQGIDFDAIELREVQRAEVKRLRGHLEAGTINESEFMLLVSTRLYGEPLKDYARRMGFPYQYIKRRRLQVEDRIARKEKRKQKT